MISSREMSTWSLKASTTGSIANENFQNLIVMGYHLIALFEIIQQIYEFV